MRVFLFLLFIMPCFPLSGQHHHLRFSHFSSDDGLSSSWVTCILQDPQGYIWIGTGDGLNRYDGYNFEVFKSNPKDSTSLSSNFIYSLNIDSQGELWIGTSRGVNIYNRTTNTFTRKKDLPPYNIYAVTWDQDDNILIGSQNLYVYSQEKGTLWEYFPDEHNPHSISNGMVNTIYIDSRKNIWIGTQNGLNLFDSKRGTFRRLFSDDNDENSLLGNDVRAITEDKNNRIWIGTTSGLNELHLSDDYATPFLIKRHKHNPSDPSSISQGAILSLHCDPQNNLWIGTQNGGLNVISLDLATGNLLAKSHYKYDNLQPDGIKHNSIECIFEDHQGNIWLGTYAGGINLFRKEAKKFNLHSFLPQTSSINNNQVNVIFEEDRFIWIGTEGGLNQYDKKTKKYKCFKYAEHDPSTIGADAVWAIAKDKEGQLWIGTWGGGLNRFDYKSEKFVRYQNRPADKTTLGSNNVFAVYPDDDGSLLIGTMGGGLNIFHPKNKAFKQFTISNSAIQTNYVESIIKDASGQFLIANVNGVTIFDKEKESFKPLALPHDSGINLNALYVYTMYMDSRMNIWLGTEAGLFGFDSTQQKVRHYTMAEGLSNNSVKSILEDGNGNLWMGSSGGIIKFIEGIEKPLNPQFINYTIHDGLQGNEFNRRASLKNKDGLMYFGGVNGYNTFHPDSIFSNPYKSKVIISSFLLFNKPVEIGAKGSPLDKHISEKKQIVLDYNQNSFGFKFIAINYLSPEKNMFAYKLQGFEDEWNVGYQREANYTNLNPGSYTFMVKASNNDGIWNDEPEVIQVIINPPLWQTTWAYIFYGVVLIGMFILYRRYSLIEVHKKRQMMIDHLNHSKQEEITQAKLHFFTNLSHEIRTPLTLISAPVEDMLNDAAPNQKAKEQLQLVNHNIKRLLHLVNQLLDFRKIDTGSEKLNPACSNITSLIYEVVEAFNYQNGLKHITFSIRSEEEQLYAVFDYEKMTTILYNLISNAVKYNSQNGKVDIGIKRIKRTRKNEKNSKWKLFQNRRYKVAEFIEVRIADQGIGIPQDQLERIFDRFYQVPQPNLNGQSGTGIGLNITKKYVELHGGFIWAESLLGKGSCFVFQIPVNLRRGETELPVKEYKPVNNYRLSELINEEFLPEETCLHESEFSKDNEKNGKPVILIVEDNIELNNYLEQCLQEAYTIMKAFSGTSGLQLADKFNPDLIISDIMMPGMDGVTMTRHLKTDVNTSHIPVILLTAKALDEHKIEGIENGADAYISKPFKIELLRAYIITILESRRRLKERYSQQLVLEPGDITLNTTDERFLKKLLQIVEENISNTEFNVQELSDKMNMSYRALARKVKSLTNQTVNEFIRTIRLKRAMLILSKDKFPIAEVSELTGFNDPAYFSRCFQKQFGVPPSSFTSTLN